MPERSHALSRLRWSRAVLVLAVVVFGAFSVNSASAQHCMYQITAIVEASPCSPGNPSGIFPEAMNDQGVVTGSFGSCSLGDRRPFIWSEKTGFVEIPLPAGVASAEPNDINNNGEIVGSLHRPAIDEERAFHWADGVWTELEGLQGFPQAHAYAISDNGEIVGDVFNPFTGPRVAVHWQQGKITELELPIGPWSQANDINNSSEITGWMAEESTTELAFLVLDETVINIGTIPGGTIGRGIGVNRDGVIAGQGHVRLKSGTPVLRSFIATSPDDKTDLGVLLGFDRTNAQSINAAAQVVGFCNRIPPNSGIAPFLWQHGDLIDLRTLIEDLPDVVFPQSAHAINGSGQIAVQATTTTGTKMVVLSPKDRALGDVNIDCIVDERDVIAVLEDWGPDKLGCPTDVVTSSSFQPPGDGKVDGADLAVVLGSWSTRPNRKEPD